MYNEDILPRLTSNRSQESQGARGGDTYWFCQKSKNLVGFHIHTKNSSSIHGSHQWVMVEIKIKTFGAVEDDETCEVFLVENDHTLRIMSCKFSPA